MTETGLCDRKCAFFALKNRLQDFCVGGAGGGGGGLNSSEGGAKKLIQLRESYEMPNFSYQFFYKQQLRKKAYLTFSRDIKLLICHGY